MAWADILKILVGRKTAAENEVEQRFKDAMEKHQGANGEVRLLREKLQQARDDVHARIEALSPGAGGSATDGNEAQEGSTP